MPCGARVCWDFDLLARNCIRMVLHGGESSRRILRLSTHLSPVDQPSSPVRGVPPLPISRYPRRLYLRVGPAGIMP